MTYSLGFWQPPSNSRVAWPGVNDSWLLDCAPTPFANFRECARDCPEMIVIPAGAFSMGSPASELGHADAESPQHAVAIVKSFAVSKFDVTFADWDACVTYSGCPEVSDGGLGRGAKPVINVNWNEAQLYVAWLSQMTGRPYRLLTEAEWEYSARAGTNTAYSWGDDIGVGNADCDGCGSPWDKVETSPVDPSRPTHSASTTWLAMSRSGRRTVINPAISRPLRMARPGSAEIALIA
jgi:formylglycine-generating enzyme required for sulfatase activity